MIAPLIKSICFSINTRLSEANTQDLAFIPKLVLGTKLNPTLIHVCLVLYYAR